jgi:hypothetical protein
MAAVEIGSRSRKRAVELIIARGNPPEAPRDDAGVGAIVTADLSSAADDPARFRSSRIVGSYVPQVTVVLEIGPVTSVSPD